MTDADQLRDTARDVLSDPKYAASEPGLLDRAWNRFVEFLDQLVGAVFGGAAGGFGLGWVLLAVLLALIAYFVMRIMPRRRTVARTRTQPDPIVHGRRSRGEWLEEAQSAESRGRFKEAVQAHYRATVAGLAERDELADDDADTTGERRRAFTAADARVEGFVNATRIVEETVYGGVPAGAEHARQLQRDDSVIMDGER